MGVSCEDGELAWSPSHDEMLMMEAAGLYWLLLLLLLLFSFDWASLLFFFSIQKLN